MKSYLAKENLSHALNAHYIIICGLPRYKDSTIYEISIYQMYEIHSLS